MYSYLYISERLFLCRYTREGRVEMVDNQAELIQSHHNTESQETEV